MLSQDPQWFPILWPPEIRFILWSPAISDLEHLDVRQSAGQALKDMDRNVDSRVRISGFSYQPTVVTV